jgi:hypothetical protein
MGAEPPPPPQVSPDGRFYWDGTRWVPMQTPAAQEPPQQVAQQPPVQAFPQQVPPTYAAPKKGHALRNGAIGCVGLIVLLIIIGIAANGANKTTSTSNSASNSPTASEPTSASAAPSASKFVTFGSGTKVVGKDIQAGTYRTRHDSTGCYFARLKGFSGTLGDILANDNTDARVVVTILPTDAGFQSSNCDTWSSDLSAITTSKTSFGDADFIVGTDMVPGTYRNTASSGCYYARLSGFDHTLDNILANENTDAQAVVTIAASDKGFESSNCGTWTKIG